MDPRVAASERATDAFLARRRKKRSHGRVCERKREGGRERAKTDKNGKKQERKESSRGSNTARKKRRARMREEEGQIEKKAKE